MKKYITLAFLSLIIISCGSSDVVKGNGNVLTSTEVIASYDNIEVLGDLDVVLVDGEEGNITLKGEENLLPLIVLKVENNKLIISTVDGKRLDPSFRKELIVQVPFKTLSEIILKGSGTIKSDEPIFTANFNLVLAGSGEIYANINAAILNVLLSGSGDIILKGEAKDYALDLTGSGDIESFDLQSIRSKVSLVGSGDVEVNCTETLSVQLKGSGDVSYKGNPKQKNINISGSGEVSEK